MGNDFLMDDGFDDSFGMDDAFGTESARVPMHMIDILFDLRRMSRTNAAPLPLPPTVDMLLGEGCRMIGYHHCPALCQCARAELHIFNPETSAFDRALSANLLASNELWAGLDRFGALCWSTVDPPDWLALSTQTLGKDSVRNGWIIPVYGPYSRKGTFVIETPLERGVTFREQVPELLEHGLSQFHIMLCRDFLEAGRRAELTQREIDVTRWIVYGKTNPVIAEILDLSTHTVNGYLRRIYLKTGTTDRVSLALYAVNHGLI